MELEQEVSKGIKNIIKQLFKIQVLRFQVSKAERNKFKIVTQVPDNVSHAHLLDKMDGDNKWADAISKKFQDIEEFTLQGTF